jgi:hypothetical protein
MKGACRLGQAYLCFAAALGALDNTGGYCPCTSDTYINMGYYFYILAVNLSHHPSESGTNGYFFATISKSCCPP